jgi:hypothetical protein
VRYNVLVLQLRGCTVPETTAALHNTDKEFDVRIAAYVTVQGLSGNNATWYQLHVRRVSDGGCTCECQYHTY